MNPNTYILVQILNPNTYILVQILNPNTCILVQILNPNTYILVQILNRECLNGEPVPSFKVHNLGTIHIFYSFTLFQFDSTY